MGSHGICRWIAVVTAAGLVAGCGGRNGRTDGSGTIECTEVEVAPQVSGPIAAMPVQEGEALAKGDLVAQIDPEAYQLKCDEARAALAQSQAQLDLVLAGSRDEDIQRAREELRQAAAAAGAAKADLERIRQVVERGSGTAKQLDEAKARAEQTAAAQAAVEQVLSRLQSGSRKEEVRMARAAVDLTKARVAQAEKALADTNVTAPMDGVITVKSREAGDYATVGAPLVTLSRLDEVWLAIYVPEDRLGEVKLGQPARVKIDGDGTFYDGTVTFVSPVAEFTPRNVQTPEERAKLVYRVKITLPNPDGVFKPGMPADGYLGAAP